jgi:hypothetical protein
MSEIRTGVIRPVECMKEGWELIKSDYWILFAITLVGAIIGGATLYILLGAMICGISYCYLQKIDGRPVAFDGLWKGLQWWLPGLIVTIFMVGPLLIFYGIIFSPLILAAVMGGNLSEDELMGLLVGAFAVDLIFLVVMVCFHTLLMFAFPLVVDRQLGALAAIKTSARAVWKNLGGVAGLYGVAFVLSLLGALACGVGVYFVIPIIMAGNLVAYRKVFPSNLNNQQPPPPFSYQNAGEYRQ